MVFAQSFSFTISVHFKVFSMLAWIKKNSTFWSWKQQLTKQGPFSRCSGSFYHFFFFYCLHTVEHWHYDIHAKDAMWCNGLIHHVRYGHIENKNLFALIRRPLQIPPAAHTVFMFLSDSHAARGFIEYAQGRKIHQQNITAVYVIYVPHRTLCEIILYTVWFLGRPRWKLTIPKETEHFWSVYMADLEICRSNAACGKILTCSSHDVAATNHPLMQNKYVYFNLVHTVKSLQVHHSVHVEVEDHSWLTVHFTLIKQSLFLLTSFTSHSYIRMKKASACDQLGWELKYCFMYLRCMSTGLTVCSVKVIIKYMGTWIATIFKTSIQRQNTTKQKEWMTSTIVTASAPTIVYYTFHPFHVFMSSQARLLSAPSVQCACGYFLLQMKGSRLQVFIPAGHLCTHLLFFHYLSRLVLTNWIGKKHIFVLKDRSYSSHCITGLRNMSKHENRKWKHDTWLTVFNPDSCSA